MTADADMFGASGANAIGSGATANTDQAKFILNSFKFAIDEVAGRPHACIDNYNASYDYSDAPATYGAPSHQIVSGYRLGTNAPDSEAAAQPSNSANLDDTTGTNDEDGVALPTLIAGQSTSISVVVNQVTANAGYLQGWVDWNGDGDFADSGEQIATNLQYGSGTSGTISIPVTVPATAITSAPTYARFRWSTTSGLNSTAAASNGEVEDYTLTIISNAPTGPAFSCTPDAYMSVAANSTANTTLYKFVQSGASYTTQSQGSGANYNALGYNSADNYMYAIGNSRNLLRVFSDGTTQNLGDITGLPAVDGFRYIAADMDTSGNLYVADDPTNASTALASIYVVNVNSVSVTQTISLSPSIPAATNTYNSSYSGAYVNDLAYSLADNHIYAFIQSGHLYKINPATGVSTLLGSTIGAPGSASNTSSGVFGAVFADQSGGLYGIDNITGDLYAFNRSTGAMTYLLPAQTGTFNDGAACALAKLFTLYDHSDAPTSGTSPNGSGTNNYADVTHEIVSGIRLGAAVDADSTSIANSNASGDGADDDGVTLPTLIQGQSANISVAVNQLTANSGFLQGWIDWNGDGDFADSGEQIATNLQYTGGTSGTISVPVTVPATAITSTPTFARFRWSTTSGLNSTAAASNGEVEDYQVTIQAPVAVDCGTESAGSGSGYATGGTGIYRNSIFWLDWSCGATTQFNPGDIVTKSWDVGSGVVVTATVSSITEAIEPYNTGNWGGDMLDDLYSGVNPIGLRNVTASLDPTYNINFVATLNGNPIPADIVAAEAEDTGNTNESATWITDGDPWQPIEAAGKLDVQFSNAGHTLFMSETADAGGGTLLALSENVSTINVNMQAGGNEAIAFGVFVPFDYADANGIASGGHYNAVTASGGSQPASLTAATSLTMATVQFGGDLYMGIFSPDMEAGDQGTATANGDDANGSDDEDGVTMPTFTQGQSATITVEVTQPNANDGYLQAWIDWNGDGDFADSGEQIATDLQYGSGTNGTISIPVTVPATAITSAPTFARFRWSTTSGLDSTTAASDGEVEDYQLTVLPQPFACEPNVYMMQGDATNTALYEVMVENGNVSLSSAIGALHPIVNAIGFREADGYIYGIKDSNNHLIRIAADGGQTDLGTIASLPAGSYNSGDFGPDGYLYVLDASGGNLQKIDVDTVARVGTGGSSPANTPDIAIANDGYAYGITINSKPIKIPLVGGAGTKFGNTTSGAFGAAYIDGTGRIFFSKNTTNDIYELNPTTGDLTLHANADPDQPVSANDGAFCRGATFPEPDRDHSDAPLTGKNYTDATHIIVSGIQLGTTVTAETAGYDSPNADGDSDDGITLPELIKGTTVTITASVAGSGGYLQGWIDWNGDGDFADTDEQVATNIQDNLAGDTDNTVGIIKFSVTVPTGATLDPTFARFRWSTTQGLDSATAAGNGEVEDYSITIIGNDYGDAPGYGDAAHSLDGATYMGTAPDVDTGSETTNGDASDDANDDGVFTDAALSSGLQGATLNLEESITLHIPVTGTGKLYAWFDWNQDSDFADDGEQVATSVSASDETVSLVVNVPLNAQQGTTYARFRFSDDDTAASVPTGTGAGKGEVEDYQVIIANNPETPSTSPRASCSGTWAAGGGGYQSSTAQGVLITATATAGSNSSWSFAPNDALNTSGVFSLPEFNGAPSLSSVFTWDTSPEDGRNANAATDAETGTLTFSFSTPVKNPVIHLDRLGGYGGNSGATPQSLSNSAIITLNSANASATFTGLAGTTHFEVTSGSIQRTPNETLVWGESSAQSGTDSTRYTAMGSVQVNGTFSSLALDMTGIGVEGAGGDGIEFVVCAYPYDYGDAPDSYGDADHRLPDDNTVYLGTVKGEGDNQSQNTANGGTDGLGDNNDGTADEDGVANLPALSNGAEDYSINVAVNNTSGSTARLVGWIDFDGNGTFDSDEATSINIASGANNKIVALTWNNLPGDIQPGDTYLRLRLTTDSSIATGTASTSLPTGTADDGEVEDYALTIDNGGFTVSGTVYNDANVNGANNAEDGLKDVTVVLYDTAGGTCRSTRTGADGSYYFSGVQPAAADNYVVYEAAEENHESPTVCPPVATDPNGYVSSTANTQTITVSNANVSGVDFGDVKVPTFTLDNTQVILPNTVVAYPHIFRSDADGSVTFSLIDSADPSSLEWGTGLYLDNNCDAALDAGDTAITGSISVSAGDKLCILTKVLAPANATSGAEHTLDVTSNFTYGDGSVITVATEQARTDITSTSSGTSSDPVGGEGKLSLVKSVWNATRGTTVGDNDGSVALPGETLRYTIRYENIGNGELDELVVHDSVPAFTQLGGTGLQCGSTPPELSACTPTELGGALNWTFTGQLPPGSSGDVYYEVVVE